MYLEKKNNQGRFQRSFKRLFMPFYGSWNIRSSNPNPAATMKLLHARLDTDFLSPVSYPEGEKELFVHCISVEEEARLLKCRNSYDSRQKRVASRESLFLQL
ncbi:hypothetical protein NPIL_678861 [Nephila pilipes]|uniref:Uncharacterized protein n=1 Tax=Nephila pilipes TaxID=299642 RepID=A0A8X6QRX9_NEPPI|nr:hypothetical protein NPIL_678861 [Nephila pilipes]